MPGLGLLTKGWKIGKGAASAGWKTTGWLGTHTKGAALAGFGVYGGWQKLTTGHFPGEETARKAVDALGSGIGVVKEGLDATKTTLGYANDALERVPELINDTKEALSGAGGTLKETLGGGEGGGQGGGLFSNLFGSIGNLFGGLFKGGVGNILGLVASAFMLFGNFGWMAKIGGLLLGALSMGLFKGNSPSQEQAPVAKVQPREAAIPADLVLNPDEGSHVVHRGR